MQTYIGLVTVGVMATALMGCSQDWRYPIEKGGEHGFVDAKGRIVIETRREGVRGFSEGLAPFWDKEQFGFLDLNGEVAISPQFDSVGEFSKEGLAPVRIEG